MDAAGLLRSYVGLVILERRAKERFSMADFRSLRDRHAMAAYLGTHAGVLGRGLDREVYDTGLGYVVKLAKDAAARDQNKHEVRVASRFPQQLVVPFLVHDADFWWIAAKKVRNLAPREVDARIEQLTGLSNTDQLENAIRAGCIALGKYRVWLTRYGDVDAWKARHERLMGHNEWYAELFNAVVKHDVRDLNEGNWGLDERGNLVIIDLGV